MQGTDSLDDLLEGSATATDSTPAEVPVETASAPIETGEKPDSAVPPADAKPDGQVDETWTKQAVLDERRKRQELEKKLREFEARLQPQQQPQQQAKPDWWAAPDQAAIGLQQQMEMQVFETRVALSERLIKQQHPDYDEVSNLFAERARQDPRLIYELMQHPLPAEFAYQVGQQIKLMDEIGSDPGAYRARLEAEILAKHGIQAGQPPAAAPRQAQARQAPTQAVPRSLARDVSAQPRTPKGQFASLDQPASLEDLLG